MQGCQQSRAPLEHPSGSCMAKLLSHFIIFLSCLIQGLDKLLLPAPPFQLFCSLSTCKVATHRHHQRGWRSWSQGRSQDLQEVCFHLPTHPVLGGSLTHCLWQPAGGVKSNMADGSRVLLGAGGGDRDGISLHPAIQPFVARCSYVADGLCCQSSYIPSISSSLWALRQMPSKAIESSPATERAFAGSCCLIQL